MTIDLVLRFSIMIVLRFAFLSLVFTLPAVAGNADIAQHAALPLISELRLGSLAHDPASPERGSVDLNAEILFQKPVLLADSRWDLLVPRPHFGGTLSVSGKTSHLYSGLSWSFDLTSALFIEGALGAALHDGKSGAMVQSSRNAMGCSLHFREAASIGYRFDAHWSLMGTIEHISNAGLCKDNRGLTNLGMRIGYRF